MKKASPLFHLPRSRFKRATGKKSNSFRPAFRHNQPNQTNPQSKKKTNWQGGASCSHVFQARKTSSQKTFLPPCLLLTFSVFLRKPKREGPHSRSWAVGQLADCPWRRALWQGIAEPPVEDLREPATLDADSEFANSPRSVAPWLWVKNRVTPY